MPSNDLVGDDNQLIELIKTSGDLPAFRQLYERYTPMVMGFSLRIVGNRAAAEDITQETFWRVWENAAQYKPERGSFTNWLFGIARNLSIDALRRRDRVDQLPFFDDRDPEGAAMFQPLLAGEEMPEEEAWWRIQRSQLTSALAALPAEQRDVIRWIYFEGKTRRQIAAEQDIPFGTINTRAKLALQKLQHLMTEMGLNDA